MMQKRRHNLKEVRLTVYTFIPKERIIVRKHFFVSWNSTFYGRHFMYDISSSYMMYLTVSHYTADHHSAFCVLRSAFIILRSAFCVLRSAFCVLRSAFCVLRSAFCVLHSAFCKIPLPTFVRPEGDQSAERPTETFATQ